MNHVSVSQVLARANATMVGPDLDVTGALASLLLGATQALPASAAAVLVEVDGTLDVLASTSHRATDIEAYQQQVDQGPCLDAIRNGEVVSVAGPEALSARWPLAGPAITRAGYASVQATPLRWHGRTFGALNVFRTDGVDFTQSSEESRALADAVTLVLVTGHLDGEDIADGLRAALEERAVVERAKGALAQTRSVDISTAFDVLVAYAHAEGVTLGVAARLVMERARTGRLDTP